MTFYLSVTKNFRFFVNFLLFLFFHFFLSPSFPKFVVSRFIYLAFLPHNIIKPYFLCSFCFLISVLFFITHFNPPFPSLIILFPQSLILSSPFSFPIFLLFLFSFFLFSLFFLLLGFSFFSPSFSFSIFPFIFSFFPHIPLFSLYSFLSFFFYLLPLFSYFFISPLFFILSPFLLFFHIKYYLLYF